MSFLNKIRKNTFWVKDALLGGRVSSHFSELEDYYSSADKKESVSCDKLTEIIEYAIKNTSFYSEYKNVSVEELPVVNKNLIRSSSKKFFSGEFNDKQRIPMTTSGSTGTPFTVYQSKEKKYRNTADTIYFASLGGYKLGERLYYYKIWSDYNRKSTILRWMQNIIAIDVLNLNKNLASIINRIKKNKNPIHFLGYVSAIDTLCKYLKNNNLTLSDVKINSVITMSESLDRYTQKAGEKYFGCKVLGRYSNIENGILAQQTLASSEEYVINSASYYLEIMDMEKDVVLPYGNLGRIVVTDFYNRAMPLLRYDTGDVGIMEEKFIDGSKKLVLSQIEGRKLDQIYNTKGELISSYIVYKNMWKYTEIEQYQLIQKDERKYEFKISMKGDFQREEQLIREFVSYLGKDANFKVKYVHEIPLLNSGKRKKVINKMNK
jgi:phenylacetate-CoA ligase